MAPTIYTSNTPAFALPSTSLFSYLFSQPHDADRAAFTDGVTGRTLTRGDTRTLALRVARGARTRLGLARGEPALLLAPNCLEFPITLLALLAAGAPATPANAAYTPPEIAYQYADAGARLLFVHPTLLPVARAALAALGLSDADARARLVVLDLNKYEHEGLVALGALIDGGELVCEEAFEGQEAHATAVMCYSSGTTGKPKGVEVSCSHASSLGSGRG
jgi:4-coumarate--CoA ligase